MTPSYTSISALQQPLYCQLHHRIDFSREKFSCLFWESSAYLPVFYPHRNCICCLHTPLPYCLFCDPFLPLSNIIIMALHKSGNWSRISFQENALMEHMPLSRQCTVMLQYLLNQWWSLFGKGVISERTSVCNEFINTTGLFSGSSNAGVSLSFMHFI